MKIKTFKSGLVVGTLTIVAGKGYLSYRNYNLQDVDLDDKFDKPKVDAIVAKAQDFCKKNRAQLWAY